MAKYKNIRTLTAKLEELVLDKGPVDKTGNQYSVIEYPIGELGGDRYPHFVMFFINDTSKAVAVSGDELFSNEAQKTIEKRTSGSSLNRAILSGDLGLAKNNANWVDSDTISNVTKNLGVGVKFGVINLGNNITEGVNKLKGVVEEYSTPRKRLKKSLSLPMPLKVRANYNAGYNETDDVGAWGAAIAAAITPDSDFEDTLKQAVVPVVVGAGLDVGRGLTGLIPIAGDSIKNAIPSGKSIERITKQIQSKLVGQVFNKRQEQLFNSMEFRVHQFSYLFIPRTEKESEHIHEIIHNFKYYMHPEINEGHANASLLITPAEFDIQFRHNNMENDSVHRIATCALKDMDVNYTAIGEFVAFKGTDNPVAISLDLSFVELEPIHRSLIKKYRF